MKRQLIGLGMILLSLAIIVSVAWYKLGTAEFFVMLKVLVMPMVMLGTFIMLIVGVILVSKPSSKDAKEKDSRPRAD